jgi:hypothetical protein
MIGQLTQGQHPDHAVAHVDMQTIVNKFGVHPLVAIVKR